MYPDVVGWIKVEGTPIDYPVMQDRNDDDYYLKHNFEGKEDNKGAPFVSADACIDPLDQNLVIFGHNVSDGSQFGELDRYLDYDFYQQHSTIEFDTIYETGTYQIVAVVKTHVKTDNESGFRYYWFREYENRGEFQDLLDFIEDNKVYDTGEYLSYGDTTIMLSTCEYTVDNGRLVIIAKRM
jgi:sortase B